MHFTKGYLSSLDLNERRLQDVNVSAVLLKSRLQALTTYYYTDGDHEYGKHDAMGKCGDVDQGFIDDFLQALIFLDVLSDLLANILIKRAEKIGLSLDDVVITFIKITTQDIADHNFHYAPYYDIDEILTWGCRAHNPI
jgi:hypothetical protein